MEIQISTHVAVFKVEVMLQLVVLCADSQENISGYCKTLMLVNITSLTEHFGEALLDETKKYSPQASSRGERSSKKVKWIAEDLADERTKPIITAYGVVSFGHLCGNVTSPANHIKRVLLDCVKERNKHAPIFLVQICAVCKTRTTKHAQNNTNEDIYPVLYCSLCKKYWNRDHMASLNMKSTFIYMADHNNRGPQAFTSSPKKKEDNEQTISFITDR